MMMEQHGNSTNAPFAMPTDIAVLHRPPLASPASFSSPAFAYGHCAQVVEDKEARYMESIALKTNFRPEMKQQKEESGHWGSGDEGVCWGFGEKGNIFGEGFSVDELLDLGDFGEEIDEDSREEAIESVKVEPLGTNEVDKCISSSTPSLAGIALPAHDATDLEWVSYIIDDTLPHFQSSGDVTKPSPLTPATTSKQAVESKEKRDAFSPPEVCKISAEAKIPPFRAKRTKRCRLSSSPTSSSASSCIVYNHHTVAVGEESVLVPPPPPHKAQKPKKRGRKPRQHALRTPFATVAGERQCSHCGVNKTPQWRAGPEGAKTLCNACGVRFKSGRLLPEYRPACSPTFESSKHSNSHRKVLEMRKKREAVLDGEDAVAPTPVGPL